jgi:hypothetical protein
MRFVQMDPYEYVSIPNSFVYVVDRPIAKRDPMGLEDTSAYDATGGGATGALAEASVLVAGWEASGIAGTSGLPGNAQGERDAFRHCLWMCLMVQLLVNDDFSLNQALHVASSAGKGHDPKNDKSAKMDLANNATSLKRCAPKCAGKSEKCCVDCCWDLLEQKALQVNTPSHPVPGRDYPNYTCGVERPGYWKIARGIIFGPVAGSE